MIKAFGEAGETGRRRSEGADSALQTESRAAYDSGIEAWGTGIFDNDTTEELRSSRHRSAIPSAPAVRTTSILSPRNKSVDPRLRAFVRGTPGGAIVTHNPTTGRFVERFNPRVQYRMLRFRGDLFRLVPRGAAFGPGRPGPPR
jgi:hypothetical protein